MIEPATSIDLDRLLRMRVVVARIGEMDLARWWNTKGQLGPLGAAALRRGFPRTHYFAQARSVFAVAARRCREVFDSADAITLWQLPATVEEEFDARWEQWLDHAADWQSFYRDVAALSSSDLVDALKNFELVSTFALDALNGLRRASEGRSVPLPSIFGGSEDDVILLALGFAHSEVGAVAVPFAKRTEG